MRGKSVVLICGVIISLLYLVYLFYPSVPHVSVEVISSYSIVTSSSYTTNSYVAVTKSTTYLTSCGDKCLRYVSTVTSSSTHTTTALAEARVRTASYNNTRYHTELESPYSQFHVTAFATFFEIAGLFNSAFIIPFAITIVIMIVALFARKTRKFVRLRPAPTRQYRVAPSPTRSGGSGHAFREHVPWDGSWTNADYVGQCPRCHNAISIGDEITWWNDRGNIRWIHVACG